MASSEFIKRVPGNKLDDKLTGFIALLIVTGLNILNAFLFGGDLRDAVKVGFIAAFVAVGIFPVGKNTIHSLIKKDNASA